MRRALAFLVALGLFWPAPAGAATPLPPELPPLDLAPLVPLVAVPMDKPPVLFPEVPLPDPPYAVPPLPAASLVVDFSRKPVAPLSGARMLACNPLGTFFGMASELFECGRARFQQGDLEEARVSLEAAARSSGDRALIRQARYWLGETLVRLGRYNAAEREFLLATQDGGDGELQVYATLALGWVSLQLNEPGRALAHFEALRRGAPVPALAAFVNHGRAMALYALGRLEEARDGWRALLNLTIPRQVALDATFWLGETLGRLGDIAGAVDHLRRFTAAGPHPMLERAILRLGWWSLAAGQPLEAAKAYRWFLGAYPRGPEWPWARLGLAQSLLALGDWTGARGEIREIQRAAPTHPFVLAGFLLLLRQALERGTVESVHALRQEILSLEVRQEVRAYALYLDGEAYRREGQSAEARSQFELARASQPGTRLGWMAWLRLAQMDLEMREFTRAAAESAGLLNQPFPRDLRALALVLHGEAAYWAGDFEASARSFARALEEFPRDPQVAGATLSLGWAELRRGRGDAAHKRWVDFAQAFSADPRAPEALLLAAEVAGKGQEGVARTLLDDLVARYPTFRHADVAHLNRAILGLREGQSQAAGEELSSLLARAPLSPFAGRARLALGFALLAQGLAGEAGRQFAEARRDGEGALAHLGLASTALALGRWEEATREFLEAATIGTVAVGQVAEYGLAVAALNEGKRDEFKKRAVATLQSPPSPSVEPPVLYVLTALAVENKSWEEARALALRLVRDHPRSEPADDAVFRLGAGALAAGEWALVRETFKILEERYPGNPFVTEVHLGLSEALLRTGEAAAARTRLEAFVARAVNDPRLPRTLLLLGQAREAAGDPRAALEAYSRFVKEYPALEGSTAARLAQGRLLQQDGRWDEAQEPLERVLAGPDPVPSGEAAFRLGEGFRTRGAHEQAAEAYMTAAYLTPDSVWARRALLGAGQSFTALRQTDFAIIVYRKLLAQPDLDPDLDRQARQALVVLGAASKSQPR